MTGSPAAVPPRFARTLIVAIALGGAVLGAPRGAAAQTAAELATAKRAFGEGEQAEEKGNFSLALAKYQQALAVKETAQLHVRIGIMQEKLGQLADALGSFERALAQAGSLPAVAKIARQYADELRPRVPGVIVVVAEAPPDLVVTLDGKPLPPGALGVEQRVQPGTHRVHAEAPGRAARDRELTVAEGGHERIELDLPPISAPPPPPPAPSKLPGAIATAAGGALLAAGAAMLAVSYVKDGAIDAQCGGSARLTCPKKDEAQILADVRTVNALRFTGIAAGALGVAGAATGIYLLVRKPEPVAGRIQIVPAAGTGFTGVVVSGSF